MRRGYSRETYLDLTGRVRELLPRAAISSDFISGFCGESEFDHAQTLSLMEAVRFEKVAAAQPQRSRSAAAAQPQRSRSVAAA